MSYIAVTYACQGHHEIWHWKPGGAGAKQTDAPVNGNKSLKEA